MRASVCLRAAMVALAVITTPLLATGCASDRALRTDQERAMRDVCLSLAARSNRSAASLHDIARRPLPLFYLGPGSRFPSSIKLVRSMCS